MEKNPVRKSIFIFLISLTMFVPLMAQTSKDELALMQLEHDWAAAYLRHDTAAISQILAEDFVGIDGRGVVTDKSKEVDEAKAPAAGAPESNFIILDDQITDMKVRLFGNVALVNGISVEKVKTKEGEKIVRFRRTTIWVKRQGRWQCVSFHGSRILESPPDVPQSRSTPSAASELIAIEKKRSEAIAKHDADYLKKLYADDFRGVTAIGFEVNKATLMTVFSRDDPSTKFEVLDREARVFRDTALTWGRLVGRSAATGETLHVSTFMHAYIRRKGRWQLVAGQGTIMPAVK